MRRAAKVDNNHAEIVTGLLRIGASVQSLAAIGKGCPDLAVGWQRRTFLLEVKNPDVDSTHRKLTPDEEVWHATWRGHVAIVHNLTEALQAIGAIGR